MIIRWLQKKDFMSLSKLIGNLFIRLLIFNFIFVSLKKLEQPSGEL